MQNHNRTKRLTKKLWWQNAVKPVGSPAISVYFYLLWQLKKQKTEPISVSDSEIATQLKINRNTVRVCRERLKNLGLVDFTISRGHKTQYRFDIPIVSDAAAEVPKLPLNQGTMTLDEPKDSQNQKSAQQQASVFNVPEFSEVLAFAKTLANYDDEMETSLSYKYESWVSNGWKNTFGKPITNWQQTVKNALPYLGKELEGRADLRIIPRIERPDDKLI